MSDRPGPATVGVHVLAMPSLGADMTHGTLVARRVAPGDTVKRGDIVAEIETQKGVFEVDAQGGGIVAEWLAPMGSRVPVGEPLLRFRELEHEPGTDGAQPAPTVAAPAPSRDGVAPSGGDRALTARATAAATFNTTAMRAAIAAAVERSKREIPHYYLHHEIELSRALAWLGETNAARPVRERLLPVALLLKAVARALPGFPELNGTYTDGAFHPGSLAHVGVAISLRGGGLIAPAIHDVGHKTLDEVMHALRDLVARTRAGGLRTSELTDATITVTSLGDQGVDSVFGVIYPPQVAIVGFGAIAERPWAERGSLGCRPVVTSTLAGDHRVSDGHRGGLFLRDVARSLQNPEAL